MTLSSDSRDLAVIGRVFSCSTAFRLYENPAREAEERQVIIAQIQLAMHHTEDLPVPLNAQIVPASVKVVTLFPGHRPAPWINDMSRINNHSGKELELMLKEEKPMAAFCRIVGEDIDEFGGQDFLFT